MPPRDKWTDGVLDERFRSIDQRLEIFADTFEVLSGMPKELADSLNRDISRLEGAIRDVATTCENFRREYRDDRRRMHEREEQREERAAAAVHQRALTRTQAAAALMVGALGLAGVVVAALIQAHVIG